MQTEIAPASAVQRAVESLRAGEIVALPTETVYGLAADALNVDAVAKIFEAKERPKFDPLIVHLPSREWLSRVAAATLPLAEKLTDAFWPGPLTLLLEKRDIIPDLVTAGLTTVAVRISAHPVFSEIVRSLDRPLAAPSANRFGRISPTSASDVFGELAGRIPLIVDGGATEHGLESTIVRVIDDEIEILRRGPVTSEQLKEFGSVRAPSNESQIVAPGQLPSHYAPRTKLIAVLQLQHFEPTRGQRVGALVLQNPPSGFAATRELSARGDLREGAANLFRAMRELDAEKLDLIVAELVPEGGIGAAINDRLRRAAR